MWQRIIHGNKSQLVVAVSLVVILLVIPLTIILSRQTADTRTRATASTTLAITPAATFQQIIVGDSLPFTITINPGTNLVSVVNLDIIYDDTKFIASPSSFVLNTDAFPVTLSAVTVTPGHVRTTVSIGADTTKVIQASSVVGTLTLKAIGATAGTTTTEVSFSEETSVFSLGFDDEASENVLATIVPGLVSIGSGPTPVISNTPTPSPNLTLTPTISGTLSATPTPTSTTSAKIALNLFLHGIGNSGDNVNPTASASSNKNPRPNRNFSIFVYNDKDTLENQSLGTLQYNSSSGSYVGTIDLRENLSGLYSIRVKTDSFLRKLVSTVPLRNNTTTTTLTATLVAGDVIADNALNILDYNIFVACAGGSSSDLPITNPQAPYNSAECSAHANRANADLNDDGLVNSRDLTLYLRELSVQVGQ